jgi:hypothetical protein
MSKTGIFMMGCGIVAALAGSAFAGDAPDAAPNTIGQFHTIRVVNTTFCVQPQGGSSGTATAELATCVPSSPAQNWVFVSVSGGTEIVNNLSGKCLYNAGSNPPVNGTGPILVDDCNVFGTNTPASNALWSPSALTGLASLKTLIGHRNNNFCLDVPGDSPFAGATLQIFTCNNTPAQLFIVGQE